MDGSMREKLLEKLLDFLSQIPEKEESSEVSEMPGGEDKGALEMIAIDAKPVDKDVLKGAG